MNKRVKIPNLGWVIASSAIVSVVVVLIASIIQHSPKPLGAFGFDVLATIIGGIAAFGGIVTGLLGLYSLNTVDSKVNYILNDAMNKERYKWELQQNNQMEKFMQAISKYNEGIFEPNIRVAAQKMEEALEIFPQLPLAAERIGFRFAEATFIWARNMIDKKERFNLKLHIHGQIESEPEQGNYLVEAILWLERARIVNEDIPTIELALAKLYAISGDSEKSLLYLKNSLNKDDVLIKNAQSDKLLFFWNCHTESELVDICNVIRMQPLLRFTEEWIYEVLNDNDKQFVNLSVITKRGAIMVGIDTPTSPTIISIHQQRDAVEPFYQIRWYSSKIPTMYPKETDEPCDIKRITDILNEWFVPVEEYRYVD